METKKNNFGDESFYIYFHVVDIKSYESWGKSLTSAAEPLEQDLKMD